MALNIRRNIMDYEISQMEALLKPMEDVPPFP